MNILDYFMYIIYRFSYKILNREKSDARWSAFLFISLWVTFIIIISVMGLIIKNRISILFVKNLPYSWFILHLLIPFVLAFRYYKYKDISSIEKDFLSLDERYQKLINWIIYTIILIVPVLTFMLFRLYAFE